MTTDEALRIAADTKGFTRQWLRDALWTLAAAVKRLREQRATLRGGIADLQRHVRVAVDEDCTRIPPGLLAVIGAMHLAAKEDEL